jgi:uncharacterized RDD family membrane protein YckC
MASQWHVGRGGQSTGPYSTEQLREMAATGRISPGDLVWKEGMAEWADCATVQGLFPATRTAENSPGGPDWNPYQPPTIDVTTASSGETGSGRMVYAEFMPRLGALILDSIFIALLTIIPGLVIVFGCMMVFGQESGPAIGSVISQLFSFFAQVAYYVVLETSAKQATWGKQIVGIKVTDLNGRRLTVGRSLGRYFAKILSGCTVIGWFLPLFTEKKQALHDIVAGTLVLDR